MRLKPIYDGLCVKLPNRNGQLEEMGSLMQPSIVERLVALRAFLYEEEAGTISVRLERKGRGSEVGYWVGYKRREGKLRKTYISEAYALDPYNLDRAAKRLLDGEQDEPLLLSSEAGSQDERRGRNRPTSSILDEATKREN